MNLQEGTANGFLFCLLLNM